jgi:hypothetical protein
MIVRKVKRRFLWWSWWTEEQVVFDLAQELREAGLI